MTDNVIDMSSNAEDAEIWQYLSLGIHKMNIMTLGNSDDLG